jgi:hypothetical protein
MTKKVYVNLFLIVVCISFAWVATGLQKARKEFIEDRFLDYTIPSQFLEPISLEFKGLASDLLLAKFMIFIGGKTAELDYFSDEDWRNIEHTLDTITDLDPYYWDAYLFSQVFLTWNEKNYRAANDLLAKARIYLPDDYRIPYYMGLNYYNFAHDPANGAKYLMEASKLPGSPYYMATLAARLSAYGSEHQRGIIFLNEMLKQTKDPDIAEQYKLRIQALKHMFVLEQAAEAFNNKYDRLPSSLSELVVDGFIDEVPNDPYGGEFYLKEDGKIDTTSKLVKKAK